MHHHYALITWSDDVFQVHNWVTGIIGSQVLEALGRGPIISTAPKSFNSVRVPPPSSLGHTRTHLHLHSYATCRISHPSPAGTLRRGYQIKVPQQSRVRLSPVVHPPLQLREKEVCVELVDGGGVGEDESHHVLREGLTASGLFQQLLEEHL